MIILSFLILNLLSSPVMSQEYPTMNEEFDDIEEMIRELEKEIPEQAAGPTMTAPSTATVTTKAVSGPVAAKAVPSAAVPSAAAPSAAVPSAAAPIAPAAATTAASVALIPAMGTSGPSTAMSNNYIDESPYKTKTKELAISRGLMGTSSYSSPSRDIDMDRDDIYHYSYMPPLSGEGYDEDGAFKGKFGHFVVTVYGNYVLYYKGTANRSTFGGNVQLGWQFDLTPVAIALMVDGGVKGSNVPGSNMYVLGPRVRVAVRVAEWLFPFLEGGLEFGKVESMSNWVYPFRVIGAGFMFKVGSLDRKAEYSLYRDYQVSRMLVIVAGEIITSPQLNTVTPDSGVIKAGLSVEFF